MSSEDTKAALAGLIDAVRTPLERNDLGRLARMHSFCQVLAEGDGSIAAEAAKPLRALATRLTQVLEKVILEETDAPEVALEAVAAGVPVLEQLAAGITNDPGDALVRLDACLGGGDEVANVIEAEKPAPAAPATQPAPACQPDPVSTAEPVAPEPPAAAAPAPDEPAATPPAAAEPAAPNAQPAAQPRYVSEPLVLDLDELEHLKGFLSESGEHMDAIEVALLDLEQDASDPDKINELFRPFHTIKGIAGFLNLRDINRLTHEVETILDMGRKTELKLTSGIIDRIFAAVDLLKAQLAAIENHLAAPQGATCPQPDIVDMMAELQAIQGGHDPTGERVPMGELLVADGAATPDEVCEALERQQSEAVTGRKIGEILVDQGAVSNKQVDAALTQQESGKASLSEQSIRVETSKLDALVDAVGELVIAQTMVNLSDAVNSDSKLQRDVSQVTKIVRDVQETAMGMRMVPIGATFQKMKRLVRDVSRKADKQVMLHISGEDTELDKTVIQQISDPLVHLVRNAVDHGIETTAGRAAAGKPAMGNVYLDAYHQGDSIVIGIRDDGRGLDREKLLAKGIERGLVTPDEQLSDQQVFALIMQAGFSTAEQITDISGRGVGMDVVKRNIEALRGKIEIISEKGTGTTINVRIPLTLAIIDGMLVRVGTERLIIPTILIEQSLRPQPEQITTVQRRGEMLRVRGELCPLVQLGQLFGYSERCDPAETLVVIAHSEGVKIGLVVDELIGQQQVVVKSLSEGFKRVRGVSGAAILGDGRVGLILEPTGLLELHKTRRNNTEVCRRRGEAEVTPSAGTVADQPAEAPYEPEAVEETTGDAETSEHEQTPEVPALT